MIITVWNFPGKVSIESISVKESAGPSPAILAQ
jgi:hypothetical protein